MTTPIADITQAAPGRIGPDARALRVAQALRDAFDIECVILFGSRARGDWTERSDIDLMIVEPEIPDLDRRTDIEHVGREMVKEMFHEFMPVDFVYLTHTEYERKSVNTLNHVARFVRREGIILPRNPVDFPGSDVPDDPDHCDEPMERQLRIADANTHYRAMHTMMDAGLTDKVVVYNAHQVLEHAMKALISAQGHEYLHVHELDRLLVQIRANEPNLDWQPVSDLHQLNNFAGATCYGPLLTPISDYADMANRITDDLNRLYDEVARLTGENPWAVPPEGSSDPIQPRYRQGARP
ncbi:MAG: nucleotidyltransferase domain-containing protein [Chloroflexota bacterium]|nr:nucleotidyltransferase domain-containing protein [Chloroflexota bacterium]MDE2960591.1 nucleotidyltransferase domain-containing protein [Chloroflexota bacterium]